jgi:nitrogenase molybdenum-iron protein alpha/beta subunit
MDPILEEMQRSREMRPDRFRSCVDYLCALVTAKDDEIASLKERIEELDGQPEQVAVKRGPGRPRKEDAHV